MVAITVAIGTAPDWVSGWEYWAAMDWVTMAEDPTTPLITATGRGTVMRPTAIRLTGFPPGMATTPVTRIRRWRQWL